MAEQDHLILTAIGPDQIGLVEKLSEFISRHGCNIEDSKMAVFCGEFAVIIFIGGDKSSLAKVRGDYRAIEAETGLSVAIKTAAPRKAAELFLPYKLTASCMDHPGIVYLISGALSKLSINIDSLETKAYSAPVTSTPLFQLEARISVPAGTNIKQLREQLTELQIEENIDVELTAIKA